MFHTNLMRFRNLWCRSSAGDPSSNIDDMNTSWKNCSGFMKAIRLGTIGGSKAIRAFFLVLAIYFSDRDRSSRSTHCWSWICSEQKALIHDGTFCVRSLSLGALEQPSLLHFLLHSFWPLLLWELRILYSQQRCNECGTSQNIRGSFLFSTLHLVTPVQSSSASSVWE